MNEGQLTAAQPVTAEEALALCVETWVRFHQEMLKNNCSRFEADEAAGKAYLRAMPTLSGVENIRVFIACVAHGLAIGIIDGSRASRLLYAAQVATSALEGNPGTRPRFQKQLRRRSFLTCR